jgi:hypothetical protein
MVNSIGLPNKGVEAYLAEDLPRYAALPVPLITNVMGGTGEELAEVTAAVGDRPEIAAVELNVSCPNVATGLDIGAVPAELEAVVRRVRPVTAKPLIVKLTPNTADVARCAQAAEAAGADAVSLVNTLRAVPLHPDGSGARWLGGRQGGLSGPAIRVVALAQVAAVAERVAIPIVGMGGVQRGPTPPTCSRPAPRSSPWAPRASAILARGRASPGSSIRCPRAASERGQPPLIPSRAGRERRGTAALPCKIAAKRLQEGRAPSSSGAAAGELAVEAARAPPEM